MKRLLVCLLLVGVVGCGSSPNPELPRTQNESPQPPAVETDAEKAKRELEKGIDFAERGNLATAIACFTKAIELDPANVFGSHFLRGLTYDDLGQPDKAIADYTRMIEIDPTFARAYYHRGLAYNKQGDQAKADADLTKAIELEPDLHEAYVVRALSYSALGEYDRAIADCTQAIELEPDLTFGYYTRANAFATQAKYDKAIADYTRAIELDPTFAKAYYRRGLIYNEKKEYDKAIADYTEAIRIDPDLADAYLYRGLSHGALGQHDNAIADYTEAIRIDPDDAEFYDERGWSYVAKGDLENDAAAQVLYAKSSVDFNAAIVRLLEKSKTPVYRDDKQIQIPDLETMIAPAGYLEGADAFIETAETAYKNGDRDTAQTYVTLAKQRNPGYYLAGYGAPLHGSSEVMLQHDLFRNHYNEGVTRHKKGEYFRTTVHYALAIKVAPDAASRGWALNNLADNLITTFDIKQRDPQRAVKLAEQACAITNWHYWAFLGTLAQCYSVVGEYDSAIRVADAYLNNAPAEKLKDSSEPPVNRKEMRFNRQRFNEKQPWKDFPGG